MSRPQSPHRYPHPIPDPQHPSGQTYCSECSCQWLLTASGTQPRNEWCSEPGSGCRCHDPSFADAYLSEMDRYDREAKERRNPTIVSGEELIAFIAEVPK